MNNYLKLSLFSLFLTGLLFSAITACQTESLNAENTNLTSESSQTSSLTIIDERLVALKNVHYNTYISDENGGVVNGNRTKIGAWEKITMITWNDGSISFKGHNGKFLSDEDGAHDIRFNREKAGVWEKFNLVYSEEYDGFSIIRAGETTNTGHNYLFGKTNIYFGLEYERIDTVYKIEAVD